MKKRVLFYLVAAFSVLSLQSCVTNYVVSKPATYADEYKTNAKFEAENLKKIANDNKALEKNIASLNNNIDNSLKNAELAKVLNHNKTIDGILSEAETYLGTPYRYGGLTRTGIDCSGFVLSVFGIAAGVNLPRVASAQSQEGERIDKSNLQKGDLIFFSHGRGRISHVAIVYEVTPEGEVKFIHSATSRGVMISSLNDSYWSPKYRFAKRVITSENANLNANPDNTLASKKQKPQVVIE